ncbi:MAG: L,D-transpeptidase family protein [Proteobacteria bacterium]|nr:L,D-transpeptidase family protein [Pseudomonadota bacterium]
MIKSRPFDNYPIAFKQRNHRVPRFRLKFFLPFLQFFCCLFFLFNAPATQALIAKAHEIEQQLAKPTALGLSKNALGDLQRFYNARQYQPVWVTNNLHSPLLDIALAFIANAETEGLDSEDYQLQHLQQLQHHAGQSSSAAVELEALTTHAVLMLARDLARGHLTATAADKDWHIPQRAFDAVAFLQEALKQDRLQQAFDELSPKNPSYQSLKKTLAHYRQLAGNHTEWVHIPSSPSIRLGDTHPHIPLIRQRIVQAYAADGVAEYHIADTASERYDNELVTAIKAFQAQHGLNSDGVIGKNTLRALNRPLTWKIRQLRINMERLRWLPRNMGERYLLVNTAGFNLTAVERDEPVLTMRIIVGRDYRSTPSFNGALSHMVLNPYWNVPVSIATKDLLPKQQSDPMFFTHGGFKVYSGNNRNAEAIDPETIDWHNLKRGFPYFLRQDPGKHNALGRIKFMFANPFNIYLHDTPSKSLFQRDIRTFSSGCIRLEKPLELAAFALNQQSLPEKFTEDLDSDKTITKHLPKPLPIYLVYITAWIDEPNQLVHFYPDIYDRDSSTLRYARW